MSTERVDDDLAGRSLGEFVLRERIGRGGFGAVYRAVQPALERAAVVKVLHPWLRTTKTAIDRFLREAKLASKLDHPYAAHIYAFGAEPDGVLWIAMELVRGTPLDEILKIQGALPLERFVPLLDRICEVVHSAHEQGIVHRDLKPGNVMVLARAGRLLPKLLDFGIAKGIAEAPQLANVTTVTLDRPPEYVPDWGETANPGITQRGAVIGSPRYMAPEQWIDAGRVTPATDLYALGVLAYEAITGEPPFDGDTIQKIAAAHTSAWPAPVAPRLPAALDQVFATALAKQPEQRYADALQLAAAFRRAAGIGAESIALPAIERNQRERATAAAPQPIAEAVAAIEAARNAHQARDAIVQLARTIARYLGLVALACGSRVHARADAHDVTEPLRALYRRSLSDREWIELGRELTRAWLDRRDAYPIPELVDAFHDSGELVDDLGALAALRDVPGEPMLDDAVVRVSRVLAAIGFAFDYPLVVAVGANVAERWMGVRRAQRTTTALKGVAVGAAALLDDNDVPVATLAPLVQVAAPSPGEPLDLFLFEGRDARGAKLVSLPSGFEHHDDTLWDWLRAQLVGSLDETEGLAADEKPPYLGLSAFSSDDGPMFFGREKLVDSVANRLRAQPLLAVVGRSGAGKSSFVQAGVLPALAPWRAITMRPGPSPIAALAGRLASAGLAVPAKLADVLARDRDVLGELLRGDAAARGPIVLVVDQLEEIFTLCLDADERRIFADAVSAAARVAEDPVRVIFTLRDDFLLRTEQIAALRDRIGQNLQLLTVPVAADLERIVVEPARRAGYEFDDATLPGEMVREVADQPGALALISFTAAKLWELRDRQFKQLTRAAYRTLGGVGGALARHAELTLEAMPVEERALAREAFRYLVTSQNTRAVVERDELRQLLGDAAQADRVVEKLVAARLLVASESESGGEIIEIVHEALLIAWPRLIEWHREQVEGARFREQLKSAAKQWHDRGRPKGLLWRGDAVTDFLRWRAANNAKLVDVEAAFAEASVNDTQRGRRLRAASIAITIIVLATGLLVLWSLNTTKEEERRKATDAQALAQERADESRRMVARQYAEQGRSELVAGRAGPALLYLLAAIGEGADQDPAMQFMLAQAARPLRAQLRVLRGHTGQIDSERLSADHTRLVTAGQDGVARVWDTRSGELLASLPGRDKGLIGAEIDPLGRRVVTAGRNGTARLFAVTGELVRELRIGTPAAQDGVWNATFSRDGALVAVGDLSGGVVRVFDASTGMEVRAIDTHEPQVEIVALSPDGKRLATVSESHIVRIWTMAGAPIATANGHKERVTSMSFSPAGDRLLTTSFDRTARVWDGATGRAISVLQGHGDVVEHGAFSADGSLVVTASRDQTARGWDPATGTLRFTLAGHAGAVNDVELDPSGRRVVTASFDGTARVWSVESGVMVASLQGHASPVQSAMFVDTDRVVTISMDGTARLWTTASGVRHLASHPSQASGLDVSRDGALVVTGGDDGVAIVSDARTGAIRWRLEGHKDGFWDIQFSPDGTRVVTASNDKTARIWREGVTEHVLPQPAEATAAAFTDDRHVAIGTSTGVITFWDVTTGAPIASASDHKGWIYSLVVSGRGDVASASDDGTVRIWTVDGQPRAHWSPSPAGVWAASFAPDGASIATGSFDGTTAIWRPDGTLLHRLAGHTGAVLAIAYSADGAQLATAGLDGSVRVWTAAGEQISVLRGRGGAIRSVQFDATGRLVITAGVDGVVGVWDASRGLLLDSWGAHRGVIAKAMLAPDRRTIVTLGFDGATALWPLELADLDTAPLTTLARCAVPFVLDRGHLVPRQSADCR